MKKTICLALCCLTLLSLSSCGIADMFGKAGITMAPAVTTTAPGGNTSSPDIPPITVDPMDFAGKDLSAYIELNYKGLNLVTSYQKREITDEVTEQELQDILIYYKHYTLETGRTTAVGDTVDISYEGYMDGEKFDGGTASHQTLLLDEEKSGYIPGFAAGLIGAAPGSTVDLNINFPENYYEELAGKPVTFKVTVHGICKAELTDEIASQMSDGKQKTVAEYRAYLKEYLTQMEDYMQFTDVYSQIFEKLDEAAVIREYPAEQLQYYYEYYVNYLSTVAANYGVSYDEVLASYGYTDETLREDAKDMTRQDLIRYYIANTENVLVTDASYREYVDKMVNNYNQQGYSFTADSIIEYFDGYYGEGYLKAKAQEENIANAVYSYAAVTYQAPEPATAG